MEQEPSFLGTADKGACDLEKLKEMITAMRSVSEDVGIAEKAFKEKKEVLRKIEQEEIPNFLLQYGLSEVKLDTGDKVVVTENISASIKDEVQFKDFLRERGEEDLAKFVIKFDRMEPAQREELFRFLLDNDYQFQSENKVNSQTLKKYFKELLGISKDDDQRKEGIAQGKMVTEDKVEDFVKVFKYFTTKIK